jgi:glycosyltransferase involved in cell wall biosynthesis
MPVAHSGVAGVAWLIVKELGAQGHTVDCYVEWDAAGTPSELLELSGVRITAVETNWQWNRWYSRNQTAAFVTSLAARSLVQRRLAKSLMKRNAQRPYDVIYQFSAIEVFGLRRFLDRLPPLVIHPETHLGGELRSWWQERRLVRRCEPLYRQILIPTVLLIRTARQRRDINSASSVVSISEVFRGWITQDYGTGKGRSVVIPNPVDLAFFCPQPRQRPNDRPVRLLFVGRISVRKGIEQIVALSNRLVDLRDEVEIRLIGGHTMWSDYRPLLEDLDSRIALYIGRVSPERVREELASADILIQPSTYEPFGLTVAEGLAMGIPVVASDQVGATEDVSPACCWRFPAGDLGAFEAAVRVAVTEVQSAPNGTIGRVARSEADRLFSPQKIGRRVAEELDANIRRNRVTA